MGCHFFFYTGWLWVHSACFEESSQPLDTLDYTPFFLQHNFISQTPGFTIREQTSAQQTILEDIFFSQIKGILTLFFSYK
jgi:hypothetical protein